MDLAKYRVTNGKDFKLKQHDTNDRGTYSEKKEAKEPLAANLELLRELQDKLYAHNQYGVLVILQAMDAAGKDGAIKHVMSGFNPQGVLVKAFKTPSVEELDHDYLWRSFPWLPAYGNITIFNRSYYEDVLVVKVHNLLPAAKQTTRDGGPDVWKLRYRQIRDLERYLTENGIIVVKLFLNISRDEQGERLLARIDEPAKNWKFSAGDVHERQFWEDYIDTYEEMIQGTATEMAPWYIIPADRKWFSRLLISEVLVETLQKLPLAYPEVTDEARAAMVTYRKMLLEEGKDLPSGGELQ